MRKLICTLALLTLGMPATMLAGSSGPIFERKAYYHPDGNAFVCINGNNMYTRALYGSNESEWRVETSDRPIFATYKSKSYQNIRFRIKIGKVSMALDSAEWCEARYYDGRRDYILRDKRWGKGQLRVSVVAYPDCIGASWMFTAEGLKDVQLEGIVSNIKGTRFTRYGDIGTNDNPQVSFQPAPGEAPLQVVKAVMPFNKKNKESKIYCSLDGTQLSFGTESTFAERFDKADKYRASLASTVKFTTPDPYINPIGGALVMSADGAWNGKVWTHGAVGWHTQLLGWRGAYAGDFLGMPDRQRTHFDNYAKSLVTDVPVTKPHMMDTANNLARGAYVWGTPMYSNGYICATPNNNHKFQHYDMNLNFIDELLWHFQFDADTAYMRKMWPLLKSHLAWEKNAWDPDGDHLYDAYCCIWASDALQYESGAVAHSSAYNYRGNLLAARIATILGEDPRPYEKEANDILAAMNSRLWLKKEGHWAEYQDFLGKKRLHKDAAVWSIYTPIDCDACSPEQAYEATRYVDSHIPHFNFTADGKKYTTISTTDWSPYMWSLNNVAMAEVLHTALAYWEAGRPNAAYKLLKGTVMDFMYCGVSPANFGQISKFDINIGEAYRDFTDVSGIASRALIQGLYGITPDALNGQCIIRPGFPSSWDSASVKTPYLEYSFKRVNGKEIYDIKQHFVRPLKIVIRQNLANGGYKDTAFSSDSIQTITLASTGYVEAPEAEPVMQEAAKGTALDDVVTADCKGVDMSKTFNSNVGDIFKNKYLSPRSPYTTLALPVQGIGDWCSPKKIAGIDDSGFRSKIVDGVITINGIPFNSPAHGHNIAYTSLWDNYPDSISVSLKGNGSHVYLLMAGSTNPMQSHFENGVVKVNYKDGTSEVLSLENPSNWCPIEQDYDDGSPAFQMPNPRPLRISLMTGISSRTLSKTLGVKRVAKVFDEPKSKISALAIRGGAAEVLEIKTNPSKQLKSLTVTTTANDVVIGLMAVTVQK